MHSNEICSSSLSSGKRAGTNVIHLPDRLSLHCPSQNYSTHWLQLHYDIIRMAVSLTLKTYVVESSIKHGRAKYLRREGFYC